MKKTNKIRRSFVLPPELRYVFRAVVLRRRPHGSISGVLPFISAVSGCALLLFAAFSLLSPPPPHPSGHLHLLRSSPLREGEDDKKSALESISAFVIPENVGDDDRDLWRTQASNLFCGCSNASRKFIAADTKTQPNRFLLIATSGGLNQQRTGSTKPVKVARSVSSLGVAYQRFILLESSLLNIVKHGVTGPAKVAIVDAVVAAYILNATLVIPKLDQKSFWKDPSNFVEIFNVDRFISFLSRDVRIIKHLPQEEGKVLTPHNMRVPRKCTPHCYESRVIPVLKKKSAVQLTKFDYRLSNRLNTDLQRLRCRVNYHALNFTDSINEMGRTLIERMRMKSQHFIALHLRFEPDMLAFSGCYYGGGDKERNDLGAIRKRWKTLHVSNPDKVRRHGRCPLTPEEVGLMLRALGYGSDVHIYVASGEVYGGEETLAPLKALFPNFHSKETIASQEELAPFTSFSSRMAALDFIVCDESDVFVTNNNGNMAKILAGRRRYFGHKPTIRPNAKKLYKLFMNRENTTWEEFASRVRTSQIGFMGVPNEIKPGRGEFHENPSPCICESSETNSTSIRSRVTDSNGIDKIEDGNRTSSNGSGDIDYEQITEADHDWPELDYQENVNPLQGETPNELESDHRIQNKFNQVELDEVFSD